MPGCRSPSFFTTHHLPTTSALYHWISMAVGTVCWWLNVKCFTLKQLGISKTSFSTASSSIKKQLDCRFCLLQNSVQLCSIRNVCPFADQTISSSGVLPHHLRHPFHGLLQKSSTFQHWLVIWTAMQKNLKKVPRFPYCVTLKGISRDR